MTVRELIAKLQEQKPDAEVGYVWDGNDRSNANIVWLAKSGRVLISETGTPVYGDKDRPITAPLDKDDPYWCP